MGDDFFGRATEQARLWRRLKTDNILLLAPRRVGKTSLLRRLEQTAEQHQQRGLYISVSDRTREIDFVLRLYHAIAQSEGGSRAVRAALRRVQARLPRLKKIEFANFITAEFAEQTAEAWQVLADALMIALRTTEHRWLLLLDEFPLFVLALLRCSRERARVFLNWFRDVRIDDGAGLSVRWIVAGSIGLDTVTKRQRLGDTINDFAVVPLGAFSRDVADQFLCRLGDSHRLNLVPHVRASILDRIEWLIPYHIQLLFAALLDLGRSEPSVDDIHRCYQQLLVPAFKSCFDWWVQRLPDELGVADAEHARALLEIVAAAPSGVSSATLKQVLHERNVDEADQRFLLDALENDGYIMANDHRFVFRSPLLRDYWRARVLTF